MSEQENEAGYLQFIRDILDLYPDEEVIRKRIAEIKRIRAHSITRIDFSPFPDNDQILAEWDPDGKKKRLREQLDLAQENPERLRRLMLVVDEQVAALPDMQATQIKDYYHFNEPGIVIPISTEGRDHWLYASTPMLHVRGLSGKISQHLHAELHSYLPFKSPHSTFGIPLAARHINSLY